MRWSWWTPKLTLLYMIIKFQLKYLRPFQVTLHTMVIDSTLLFSSTHYYVYKDLYKLVEIRVLI